MGMIFEDLEDHEGYAARRLPDGTLTSTWTRDTAAFDADVGACTCGSTRTDQHPPHRSGTHRRRGPWEHAHARPVLAAAVPARITELVDNLREEVAELADDRPPGRPRRRLAAHRLVRSRPATHSHHRATPPTRWPGSPETGPRTVAVGDHGNARC
jgi:hypothetical protein